MYRQRSSEWDEPYFGSLLEVDAEGSTQRDPRVPAHKRPGMTIAGRREALQQPGGSFLQRSAACGSSSDLLGVSCVGASPANRRRRSCVEELEEDSAARRRDRGNFSEAGRVRTQSHPQDDSGMRASGERRDAISALSSALAAARAERNSGTPKPTKFAAVLRAAGHAVRDRLSSERRSSIDTDTNGQAVGSLDDRLAQVCGAPHAGCGVQHKSWANFRGSHRSSSASDDQAAGATRARAERGSVARRGSLDALEQRRLVRSHTAQLAQQLQTDSSAGSKSCAKCRSSDRSSSASDDRPTGRKGTAKPNSPSRARTRHNFARSAVERIAAVGLPAPRAEGFDCKQGASPTTVAAAASVVARAMSFPHQPSASPGSTLNEQRGAAELAGERLGLDVQQVRIKRGRDAGGQRVSGGMLPLPELPLITTVNKASPSLIPARRSRTSADRSSGHSSQRSSSCSRASTSSREGSAAAPRRPRTAVRALHAPIPLASCAVRGRLPVKPSVDGIGQCSQGLGAEGEPAGADPRRLATASTCKGSGKVRI